MRKFCWIYFSQLRLQVVVLRCLSCTDCYCTVHCLLQTQVSDQYVYYCISAHLNSMSSVCTFGTSFPHYTYKQGYFTLAINSTFIRFVSLGWIGFSILIKTTFVLHNIFSNFDTVWENVFFPILFLFWKNRSWNK